MLGGFELVALWSMPMWTLLPVMLLSSPAVAAARNILGCDRCTYRRDLVSAAWFYSEEKVEPNCKACRLLTQRVEEAGLRLAVSRSGLSTVPQGGLRLQLRAR